MFVGHHTSIVSDLIKLDFNDLIQHMFLREFSLSKCKTKGQDAFCQSSESGQ